MRTSPVETVLTAVVSALRGSAGVTGYVSSTGVYNNVPSGARYPYVVVTSPTDRRMDTIGQRGAETMVNVQVVSQEPGDQQASRITNECIKALDFAALQTTQHDTFGCAWESSDRYSETINGIQTRYHVSIYRVWTGQV